MLYHQTKRNQLKPENIVRSIELMNADYERRIHALIAMTEQLTGLIEAQKERIDKIEEKIK